MSVRTLIQELVALKERSETPPQLKRCVAKVAPKYDGNTSRAFAICVAQFQKTGQIKKGSMELTGKGKKVAGVKRKKDDHSSVVDKYEKLLKKNRKDED